MNPVIEAITFQSTRPMRGATYFFLYFYFAIGVSIHAPHAGRDLIPNRLHKGEELFQSTRPMRGAT